MNIKGLSSFQESDDGKGTSSQGSRPGLSLPSLRDSGHWGGSSQGVSPWTRRTWGQHAFNPRRGWHPPTADSHGRKPVGTVHLNRPKPPQGGDTNMEHSFSKINSTDRIAALRGLSGFWDARVHGLTPVAMRVPPSARALELGRSSSHTPSSCSSCPSW